jgi:hypothetical protein
MIVSALKAGALNLEISLALHLKGLSALNLELRWGNWCQIERARQACELLGLTRGSSFGRGVRNALQWSDGFGQTLPSHTVKLSRSTAPIV